jgi:hypothetical protein
VLAALDGAGDTAYGAIWRRLAESRSKPAIPKTMPPAATKMAVLSHRFRPFFYTETMWFWYNEAVRRCLSQ